MKRTDFDLGGLFAFLLAAAMTVLTAGLLVVEGLLHYPLWIGPFIAPCVAAWMGLWAWRRERWLLAAVMFLLSLTWWGNVLIFPPAALSICLALVSLVRAMGRRLVNRKVSRLAPPGR